MTASETERCLRCGGPTRTYFDERDEWTVCLPCRVGWWTGSGYQPPPEGIDPERGAREPALLAEWRAEMGPDAPPEGAIYTAAPFWTELPAPGDYAPPAASEGR